MHVTKCGINFEKEDDEVEECEGEVSSHDVPDPVPAGIGARDTGHVEGVGQREVDRLTSSTQSTHLVHPSTEIIQLTRGDSIIRNVTKGTIEKGGVHAGSV